MLYSDHFEVRVAVTDGLSQGGRRTMRIEHLLECLDLSETLNFTQTARHFFVTQPALSKHISSLEQELGLRIFLRDQRRIRLTKAGEEFIKDARKVTSSYHEMLEGIRRFKDGMGECISVGYLVGAGSALVAEAHSRFSKYDYSTELRYYAYEFSQVNEALVENKVDLVIMGITEPLPDDRFEIRLLYEDKYYAVMAQDHPLANREVVELADLRGETIPLPSREFWNSGTLRLRDFLKPEENGIIVEEVVQDINSLLLLLAVENCVGITFGHLEKYYASQAMRPLVFVPIKDSPVGLQIVAAWKLSNTKSALPAYARILQDAAEDLGLDHR